MTSDRPIIFSAPMVRALLDGRKTMTRRLAPLKEVAKKDGRGGYVVTLSSPWRRVQPGGRLWVRETWSHSGTGVWSTADARRALDGGVLYRVDDDGSDLGIRWWPSIHMPRWASRLTLTVTAVRVERLQEISEADARAEGVSAEWSDHELYGQSQPYRYGFSSLWNSLHGPGAWDANPEVVAIAFTVERRNIDDR